MAAVGELRPAAVSELVTLYVGGVAFETTRGTLTSVADSALARLYIAAPTSDPPYHFDRDPDIFRAVLSGLRRRIPPRKPDAVRTEEWEDDLRFWGLLPPAPAPAAKAAPTTASEASVIADPAKPPVEEVPAQVLLQAGQHNTYQYRLPAAAYGAPLAAGDPKALALTVWAILSQIMQDGSHGKTNTEDRSWSFSLSYRVLRRLHHLPRAIGAPNWSPVHHSLAEGFRTNWWSVHLFLRGVNIDALPPAPPEVFDAAMRAVVKGFADQRLNEDLRWAISTSGVGDEEVLSLKLTPPK